MLSLDFIEAAIAAEAAAHARAAAELNPYGEAEALNLGRAEAVYSGAVSQMHGVFGLGLDGPPEERDWQEIDRFFARKERAAKYWIAPFTDPAVLENIKRSHRATIRQKIHGQALEASQDPINPFTGPDLDAWSKAFGEAQAFVKIHQKNTRFFLRGGEASYTFFHQGIALIPHPTAATLPQQLEEHFQSKAIVVMGECDLPFLYERVCYEPI